MIKWKRWFNVIVFLLLPLAADAYITIDTAIKIKPGNADKAATQLADHAKSLNGYFVTKSSQKIVLKIPSASANTLQKFIEDNWRILDQRYDTFDVTSQVLRLQSQLKAKEALLDEYQQVLDTAKSNKIVTVSSAVAQLVQQIEMLRGQLRKLDHQSRFAQFSVEFMLSPTQINTRKKSSFSWLNNIGSNQLMSDFQR